jgi:hypothetical protein
MVYIFVLIVFIPWPFYKDIVAATSGGGNRDVMKELEQVETGRFLHRFPHNKVSPRHIIGELDSNVQFGGYFACSVTFFILL